MWFPVAQNVLFILASIRSSEPLYSDPLGASTTGELVCV